MFVWSISFITAIYRFKYKHFMSNITFVDFSANALRACFSCLCIVCFIFVLFVRRDRVYMHPRQLIMQIIVSSSDYNWCTYVVKYRINHFFIFLIQHSKCLNSSTEMETFSVSVRAVSFKVFNAIESLWTKLEVNKNVSVMF